MKYENKLLQLILNKINEQKQQRGGFDLNLNIIQKGLEEEREDFDFENSIFRVLYCIFSRKVNKAFTNKLRTELNSDYFTNFLETEKELLAMIFMYTNFSGLFEDLNLLELTNAMKYILSTCLKLRLEQTSNFNDTTDISKVNKTKFIINFFLFYEKKQNERNSNGKLFDNPKNFYTSLYNSLEERFTSLSTKDIFVKMIGTENRVENVNNRLNQYIDLNDLLQNLFNLKESKNSNENSKAGVDKVFEDGNYLVRKSTLDYHPKVINETIDKNLNAFLDEYSLFGDKVINKFRIISKEFNDFFNTKCGDYLEQASQLNSKFTKSYKNQLTATYNEYAKDVGKTAVTYYNIYLMITKQKYIPKIDKTRLSIIKNVKNKQVQIYKNSLGINTNDYNNALVNKKYAEKVGHLENARRVLKRRKQGNTTTNTNVYNGLKFFKRPANSLPSNSVEKIWSNQSINQLTKLKNEIKGLEKILPKNNKNTKEFEKYHGMIFNNNNDFRSSFNKLSSYEKQDQLQKYIEYLKKLRNNLNETTGIRVSKLFNGNNGNTGQGNTGLGKPNNGKPNNGKNGKPGQGNNGLGRNNNRRPPSNKNKVVSNAKIKNVSSNVASQQDSNAQKQLQEAQEQLKEQQDNKTQLSTSANEFKPIPNSKENYIEQLYKRYNPQIIPNLVKNVVSKLNKNDLKHFYNALEENKTKGNFNKFSPFRGINRTKTEDKIRNLINNQKKKPQ